MRGLRDARRRAHLRQPPLPRGPRDLRPSPRCCATAASSRRSAAGEADPRAARRADARPAGGGDVRPHVAHAMAAARPCSRCAACSVGARVRDVDLEVRRGEIVGVCGLLGSGQNELARARLRRRRGRQPATCAWPGSTRAAAQRRATAVEAGAGLITENRQDEGLFPSLSVPRNISVASLARISGREPCARSRLAGAQRSWRRRPSAPASRRASCPARS